MSLSCTVSEIYQDIGRKSPFELTRPLSDATIGVTPLEFRLDFLTSENKSPWAIIWRLHDSAFNRFDTIPACDRWTDGQTDT